MNSPDPWADFAEVFAEELNAQLTTEQMDEMADAYQRESIATANSEQAQADNVKAYSHE